MGLLNYQEYSSNVLLFAIKMAEAAFMNPNQRFENP